MYSALAVECHTVRQLDDEDPPQLQRQPRTQAQEQPPPQPRARGSDQAVDSIAVGVDVHEHPSVVMCKV